MELYQNAADVGDVELAILARCTLASIYEDGQVVAKEMTKAVPLIVEFANSLKPLCDVYIHLKTC